MSAFSVRKSVSFSYGHRIRGHEGPCRHLHGHTGRAEIECAGPLDDLGMVVDFARIRAVVKEWIDANWDHRMLLERGDPIGPVLEEQGEPVRYLDGPPTAENMARRLCEVARDAGLPVVAVHLWETDGSVASYRVS